MFFSFKLILLSLDGQLQINHPLGDNNLTLSRTKISIHFKGENIPDLMTKVQ